MAKWRVGIFFKPADSEAVGSANYTLAEDGRRLIEEWQRRVSSRAETPPALVFPTADVARQFFSAHTVRRIDMQPGA
jgi:hypothetical protein